MNARPFVSGCIEDADVQQNVFQALMNAMARPGIWNALPEEADALSLVLAALCDQAAGFADVEGKVDPRTRLHIGAPVLEEGLAPFVVASGENAAAAERQSPRLGTLEDPHLSTTFVLVLPEQEEGVRLTLKGPGIPSGGVVLDASGLEVHWLVRREMWVKPFPQGVDFLLLRGAAAAAIPRTTQIVNGGAV